MSDMTPERLAEVDKQIKSNTNHPQFDTETKMMQELRAHIDAQQRTIEQLEKDKWQLFDQLDKSNDDLADWSRYAKMVRERLPKPTHNPVCATARAIRFTDELIAENRVTFAKMREAIDNAKGGE